MKHFLLNFTKVFLLLVLCLFGEGSYTLAKGSLEQFFQSPYAFPILVQSPSDIPKPGVPIGKIEKIAVSLEQGTALLDPNKIVCCKKWGKDVMVFYQGKTPVFHVKQTSLQSLEAKLMRYPQYFRLNSALVNLGFLEQVIHQNVGKGLGKKHYQYTLVMENGGEIPLPQAKRKALIEQLNHLLAGEELT